MLVDMKPVIPCRVVSSAFATARLPINPGAPDRREVICEILRLFAAGDGHRCAA
jgi:hypothetical protein